jgi:hypothetical protein
MMRKRILAAFLGILISGGFYVAAAQTAGSAAKKPRATSSATTKPHGRTGAGSEIGDPTPSYTYKGKWYGFLTCSRLQRQGYNVKPDDVKKCVAEGGKYILSSAAGGRTDVEPASKVAPFAGQQVWITGTITSTRYSTGPTSDESIEGLYAGGDRPATRFEGVEVISVQATKRDDAYVHYGGVSSDLGSRVSDKAQ